MQFGLLYLHTFKDIPSLEAFRWFRFNLYLEAEHTEIDSGLAEEQVNTAKIITLVVRLDYDIVQGTRCHSFQADVDPNCLWRLGPSFFSLI